MRKQVKCIFTVQSVEYAGYKSVQNAETQEWEEGPPIYNVQATPWYSPDKDHPNAKFFEATPSGQLQLFSVMNFAPKPGTEIEMLLSWEE